MEGTRAATGEPRAASGADVVVRAGPLSATLSGGAVRWIRVGDVEVVRGVDYPIRDADWGTMPTRTVAETVEDTPDGFAYRRSFKAGDAVSGLFALDGTTTTLTAALELVFLEPTTVKRAGFVVLHPLSGVAGSVATVTGPDGVTRTAEFPALISPGQPMKDIAALAHSVHGVPVELAFEGDVFETEDQRNWTDASFKTYCRPLSLPRPYRVAAGETVHQRITIRVGAPASLAPAAAALAAAGTMPEIALAIDPALSPFDEAALEGLAGVVDIAQVRIAAGDAAATLAEVKRFAGRLLPRRLDFEVVVDVSRVAEDLASVAAALADLGGLQGIRSVVALPAGYLASVQPEGPWPDGATPAEAAAAARAAFPGMEIGGGVLTNFTELNRCRPAFASDFVTFGTTAIVHAADDASVIETLEALPAVFASAVEIADGRPLRLGLCTIAMRSNPYGSGVAHNPHRQRIAMAMEDPRHQTGFAAAFAVGVAAAAARAGVASLSLGMPTGPLGLVAADGRPLPLLWVVHALARMAGGAARIEGGPGGLVRVTAAGDLAARRGGLAANLSRNPLPLPGLAVLVPDSVDGAPPARADATRDLTLPPMMAALLFPETPA